MVRPGYHRFGHVGHWAAVWLHNFFGSDERIWFQRRTLPQVKVEGREETNTTERKVRRKRGVLTSWLSKSRDHMQMYFLCWKLHKIWTSSMHLWVWPSERLTWMFFELPTTVDPSWHAEQKKEISDEAKVLERDNFWSETLRNFIFFVEPFSGTWIYRLMVKDDDSWSLFRIYTSRCPREAPKSQRYALHSPTNRWRWQPHANVLHLQMGKSRYTNSCTLKPCEIRKPFKHSEFKT